MGTFVKKEQLGAKNMDLSLSWIAGIEDAMNNT